MLQRYTFFCFFLVIMGSAFAQKTLPAQQKAPLYDHMYEVNKQWATQIDPADLPADEVAFANDVERIQTHLRWVEHTLRQRPPTHLPVPQRAQRTQLLNVLHDYWQAAAFPVNLYHAQRQPYFVDHQNTACAVGHLLRASGEEALAQRIHRDKNYAYISELLGETDLLAWADKTGFTTDELAWIQPAYNPASHTGRAFGSNGGVDGEINALETRQDILYVGGDFSAIDGNTLNNVATYDGENWQNLPGLEGVVTNLLPHTYQNIQLFAIGQFQVEGYDEVANIAYLEENEWYPLQLGDMNGMITDFVMLNWHTLLVVGDFTQVDGQDMPYLAVYDLQSESWGNLEGNLATNGPVYTVEPANGQFLLGGDFDFAGSSDDGVAVDYLTYYDPYTDVWTALPAGDFGPVRHLAIHNGIVYVAGSWADQHPFAVLSGGLWLYQDYFTPLPDTDGDALFYGFLTSPVQPPMVYGSFSSVNGGIGTFSYGIARLNSYGFGPGLVTVDHTIRAATYWQDQLLVAGSFTQLGNTPVNQLGFIELVTSTDIPSTTAAQVYAYADALYVKDMTTTAAAEIVVYDMQGRVLQTTALLGSEETQRIDLPDLPGGVYVYRLQQVDGAQSGQFVVTR